MDQPLEGPHRHRRKGDAHEASGTSLRSQNPCARPPNTGGSLLGNTQGRQAIAVPEEELAKAVTAPRRRGGCPSKDGLLRRLGVGRGPKPEHWHMLLAHAPDQRTTRISACDVVRQSRSDHYDRSMALDKVDAWGKGMIRPVRSLRILIATMPAAELRGPRLAAAWAGTTMSTLDVEQLAVTPR